MPKWFNLHRPLLYDPQLQLKIKKKVPVQAKRGLSIRTTQ